MSGIVWQHNGMHEPLPGLIDRSEFCRQLRISPRTARYWASRGQGPHPRYHARRIYYVQAEVTAYLEELRTPMAVTG